jgi:formyltetrahydrofolate-dependent phosphoribosylglycinamide formyltransferase
MIFSKLRQKWKVSSTNFALILCTFAVTGSSTAYLSRKIPEWLLIPNYSVVWFLIKILVFVFGYQALILLVGFCFGQFKFFWEYEKKILRRMGLATPLKQKTNIAIFASGSGSNAHEIIKYFNNHATIAVKTVVSNIKEAGVLQIACNYNIPTIIINKNSLIESSALKLQLDELKINFIVLAGFLLKVPESLTKAYPNKIVNIHPSLLPKYGGRGMYGNYVHQAVINANEKESGITIHFVDEQYDHGNIIFQEKCQILESDTAETVGKKVLALEHKNYSAIIEKVIANQ